jgi:hypothetical protein
VDVVQVLSALGSVALIVGAYLESSNPANDQRYQRLGFAFHGRFKLPDDGPIVTTMWRPGQGGPEPSPVRRP